MILSLMHYLILSAILFTISIIGILMNHENIIIFLMEIEIMLLSINTNLIAFSDYHNNSDGMIFVFFILTMAAAESAIGFAILIILFRHFKTININFFKNLKD
ncbi:NADH-quinone oxidoreductase subunit K [Candidatus Profftella armatura (Diaphorina cf. continua)]|uniref:NADH-quinone oxidoreductase subunit K n=1 Tax=Candidatus Profftella armatura (Diaphorina cf. continua) TaxID=2661583 RepID=A0A7R6VYU3_9PROT|nr:NADH-quinone oxidoreductase subunit NuoK [Candidatus Profftella armatura (Diaphorina cf. continua)]BCG49536.1 NADH-quinone oxidoreductase subunit K [Candidatus Profftella armatura (Diaphorina cf. continua)]